jgi:hypothetical protein
MPAFAPGQPVISATSAVQVDSLSVPGTYRFQLVVVDDRNIVSAPATLLVRIAEQDRSMLKKI